MNINITPEEAQLLMFAVDKIAAIVQRDPLHVTPSEAQTLIYVLDAYPGDWTERLDSIAGKLHCVAGTEADLDPH